MTKQSHTPGPWKVTKLDGIHPNVVAGTRHIAGVYDLCIDSQRPEDVANACLIAAAPELLAVLKDTVREDQFSDMTIILERCGHPQLAKFWRDYRAQAIAAIAKAEG